eukprot:739945-Prorocentrum_minimum.AAC.4
MHLQGWWMKPTWRPGVRSRVPRKGCEGTGRLEFSREGSLLGGSKVRIGASKFGSSAWVWVLSVQTQQV